jgi:hypothetical protein
MPGQRNVQQQNAEVFAEIVDQTLRCWSAGLPASVDAFLKVRGIDFRECAFLWYEDCGPVLGVEYGVGAELVTPTFRFFRFELELDERAVEVLGTALFEEVTESQNVSPRNRGTKYGRGYIACRALEHLRLRRSTSAA